MSRPPPPVIAIDGPAAAGKGSVARGVAAALGFHYLDSGKIYRAVAVAARDGGLLPATAGDTALAALARRLANNPAALARLLAQPRLLADEAAKDASALAARPRLRRALVAAQRAARRPPGLVADGRDMGATIFPDAAVKIFLTASARERARRRALQLRQNGMRAIIKDVLADLRRRDARDAGRNASPLRAAPTALRLSSTRATVDDLVLRIVAAFDKAVFCPSNPPPRRQHRQ